MLNMFWVLIHPSSGACEYLFSYFMGNGQVMVNQLVAIQWKIIHEIVE